MVNENNLINLVENKKPIETVQEIENYQIKKSPLSPAARSKVINKSGSDYVSERGKEGYGPVGEYTWSRDGAIGCGQNVQSAVCSRSFRLNVICHNAAGGGGNKYVYSTSEALEHARRLVSGCYSNVHYETERECARLIRIAVRDYNRGESVDGYIRIRSKFWGGYEWSRNY